MTVSQTPREWFDYASAFSPVLVALFVAFLAYRQWRVAREKLRLDLYSRRFAIYETTLKFYQALLGGTTLSEAELDSLHRHFITGMLESKFLFSKASNVHSRMLELNNAAFIIKGAREMLSTQRLPPELMSETHAKLLDEQGKLEHKFYQIETAVTPYLYFGGINR